MKLFIIFMLGLVAFVYGLDRAVAAFVVAFLFSKLASWIAMHWHEPSEGERYASFLCLASVVVYCMANTGKVKIAAVVAFAICAVYIAYTVIDSDEGLMGTIVSIFSQVVGFPIAVFLTLSVAFRT